MIVNFRQGIVSYPVGFLQKVGTPVGSRVGLNITPDRPLILAFAHRGTNYAVVQKTAVGITPPIGAFGPFLAGIDYWLFADINMTTGIVSWGSTTVQPIAQAATPVLPPTGTHWFKSGAFTPADDLLYPPTTMFLNTGTPGTPIWAEVVRVFIAEYEAASLFISLSINSTNPNAAVRFGGTQAGLTQTVATGFLIYNSDGTAFRNTDGTFVTTEDVLRTGMLFGSDIKVGNQIIQGQATTAFPAYTVVRFSAFGQVTPVNFFNIDQGYFGIVETAATIGQLVQVITQGLITNAAWNWSQANAPIYVDNNGLLTETVPSVNDVEPVAFALTTNTVVLRGGKVEVGLVDHATDVEYGAVILDVAPTAVAGYLEFIYLPALAAPVSIVAASTVLDTFTVVGDYAALLPTGTTFVVSGSAGNDGTYTVSGIGATFSTPNTNIPVTAVPATTGASGSIVIGTSLAITNTFTAQFTIENTTKNVSILGSTATTVADLLTQLNIDVGPQAVATLVAPGNIRVTSVTTGPTSRVRVADMDVFQAVGGFATLGAPVDGYFESIAASGPAFAAHVANTAVHLSVEQNTLLDLLDAATPGIVVKDAEGSMASRSLVAPAAGFTITNPAGLAGNPTFVLANDLAALEGLTTLGVVVRNAPNAAVTRVLTGTAGNIVITNGDGVALDPTFNLAAVVQGAVGTTFSKVALDGFGRVTNNTPVVTADITALVAGTYVDVAGDTMTGALVHPAGTAAAPSITFVSDLTKGFYDSGAGQVSVAIAGAEKVRFDAGGVTTFSGYAQGGAAGMGLWHTATPAIGVTLAGGNVAMVNGANSVTVTSTGITLAGTVTLPVMAANIPMGGFKLTGLGAGTVAGDSVRFDEFNTHVLDDTRHLTVAQNTLLDGLAPTLTFTELNFVDGVTSAIQTQLDGKVNDTGDTMTGALLHAAGTAAAPSISFSGGVGHTDKGWYNSGVDEVSCAIAGLQKVLINPTGITIAGSAVLTAADLGVTVQDWGSDLDDINAGTWLGAASITTLGTITTGVWTGTDVAVADGGTGSSTAAGAATNLGLGTGDSPQFTGIELGHATDTTITRVSAGVIAVEGATVRTGTVAIGDGGTGASTSSAAATNLGLGTGDSPQFTAVNVGHATDTTITRVSAGVIAVEGSNVLLASGLGSVTQAWDTGLDELAALATNGNVRRTAGAFVVGAVDLTADVTGDLPYANLAQGSARSVLGVTGNATADVASIQGIANQVLVIDSGGTALAFGAVNLAAAAAVTGTLPIGNGGTGVTSTPTNGQLLIGNGTGYTVAALTSGVGVSVTNGVGTITVATQTLKNTQAFTFGAIAANDVGTSTNTVTVTGAVAGDVVALGLPSTVPAGFTYVGYVSAADTVTIRAHGSASSGAGAGAADASINVIVMKYASF